MSFVVDFSFPRNGGCPWSTTRAHGLPFILSLFPSSGKTPTDFSNLYRPDVQQQPRSPDKLPTWAPSLGAELSSYRPHALAHLAVPKPPSKRWAPDLLEASGDVQVEVVRGLKWGSLLHLSGQGRAGEYGHQSQRPTSAGHKCSGHLNSKKSPRISWMFAGRERTLREDLLLVGGGL